MNAWRWFLKCNTVVLQREMNLLKQVDTEESEQKDKGKIVRVPSLRRKPSDKRNPPPKVTDIKSTTPLPPTHSVSWRVPLETIFSPVEKSPRFQEFTSSEVPEVPSSNKTEMKAETRLGEIIPPATPKTMGPQAASLQSDSSLDSPLSPTPRSQQHSSNLSESQATDHTSPQEKGAIGSSFTSLQTKLTTTPPEPGQRSLDNSPNLLLSSYSWERLRNTSSVSLKNFWFSPHKTTNLC